jgi:2'-5' RNA ligase
MRTFIALELPDRFADETAQLARALQAHAQGRFMKREAYHVTLAFLGEVGEVEVGAAMAALDALGEHAAVPLDPDGIGAFKGRGGKTLYLSLHRTPESQLLVDDLRSALEARGVAFERKSFIPHITLARRAHMTSNCGALPFPNPATATRVTLFKSTLSHDGATYKPLYSIELSA